MPPKNHEIRDVVLPNFVLENLAHHLDQHVTRTADSLVFTTGSGTPLRSPNFHRNIWRPAIAQAGLVPLTPHDLRRTAGSLLLSEGAGMRQVMEHLGHSSIVVTMNIYAKVFPSDMDALADRLEERHRSQHG